MRKTRSFRPDAIDDQLENRQVLSHIAASIPAHYNHLNLHATGNARLNTLASRRLNLSALEHPVANAVGAAASSTSRVVSSPKNQSPGGTTSPSTLTSLLPPASSTLFTTNTSTNNGSNLPGTTFLPATGTFVSNTTTGPGPGTTFLPATGTFVSNTTTGPGTTFLPATGTFVSNTSTGLGSTFLPATGTFVSNGSNIPVFTSSTSLLTGAATTPSANSTAANPLVTNFLNGLDTTLNNSANMIP